MKRIVLLISMACAIVGAKVTPTAPTVKDGCYSISTADELYGFAAIVNGTLEAGRAAESSACGMLTQDILANDTTTIGCYYKKETNSKDSVYTCYKIDYENDSKRIDIDPATIVPHTQWTPLKNFSGRFDGQGHTIWKLENIKDSTQNNLGFIALVSGGTEASPVVIKDLTIRHTKFYGHDTVGGIVAKNSGNLLLDNVMYLSQVKGRRQVASLVGRNENQLTIKKGVATNVTGQKFIGSAVGSNSGTIDIDSLSFIHKFNVEGSAYPIVYRTDLIGVSHVGLILGVNEKSAKINIKNVTTGIADSYIVEDAFVDADSVLGGFVGLNDKNATITISASSMLKISTLGGENRPYIGGFVGINRGTVDITNSYAKGPVAGISSGCFVGLNQDSLSVTNSYSDCLSDLKTKDPVVGECRVGNVSLKNTFYKDNSNTYSCAKKYGAKPISSQEVSNGVLTIMLHNYKGGEVWGQDIANRNYWPKQNVAFGPFSFKLNLCTTDYYFDFNINGDSCHPDSTMKSYTYKNGIAQLPVYTRYGYVFLGWAFADKPDSVITSISKDSYGDIELFNRWDGDAKVPPKDKDGCYLISTISDLYGIGIAPDKKCVKLVNDIVVNQNMENMILDGLYTGDPNPQRSWDGIKGFNGVFDGQGHKISGLYNKVFFSEVNKGDTLTIKNLGIVNSAFKNAPVFVERNNGVLNITHSYSTAISNGFVGTNSGEVYISDSYNTGLIRVGASMIGTNNKKAVLDNVYNSGAVQRGAGIIGTNLGTATISNSYNVGTISEESLQEKSTAGLVGYSKGKTTIINCFNAAPVYGYAVVGGLVGAHWTDTLTIINSYNAGPVKDAYSEHNYGIVGMAEVYNSWNSKTHEYDKLVHDDKYAVYMYNVFSLMGLEDHTQLSIQASPAVFKNGYVAKLLHDYVQKDVYGNVVKGGINGEIWGQEVGKDSLPVFKGKLVGVAEKANEGDIIMPSSSSMAISSSSSSVESSSSRSSRFGAEFSFVLPKMVDGCYRISTAQELQGFATIVNGSHGSTKYSAACGILTSDIALDVDKYGAWEPIENFAGSLDGQGHTISNMAIDVNRYGDNASFIGSINGGTKKNPVALKNITWENATISAKTRAAIINTVKSGSYVEIDHAHNGMNFTVDSGRVAAFVATVEENANLNVSYSYNTGDIKNNTSTSSYFGCIVNVANGKVTLKNVYNTGVGASLIGSARDSIIILNTYNYPKNSSYSTLLDFCEENKNNIIIENSFNIRSSRDFCDRRSSNLDKEYFANGYVAMRLHYHYNGLDYDGMEWGQDIGVDASPIFSGTVTGEVPANSKVVSLDVVSYSGDKTIYPRYYLSQTRITLPDPTPRTGYAFAGWFDDTTSSVPIDNRIDISFAEEDLTYYAKWWPLPKRDGKCYKIGSAEEMLGFSAIVNGGLGIKKDSTACAILTADIVLDSSKFLQWTAPENFAGSLDGQGHSISFGWTKYYYDERKPFIKSISGGTKDSPVTIKNVEWKNVSAEGTFGTSLIHYIWDSSYVLISANHNDINFVKNANFIGTVGEKAHLTISNSYNTGSFSGDDGYFIDYVLGNISFLNFYDVGTSNGFVGTANDSVIIENSYSLAQNQKVGFVKSAKYTRRISINNSYYLDTLRSDFGGFKATAEQFANGSIAAKLHYDYDYDGSIWGQKVGVDLSPNFSKEITGASDSSIGRFSIEMVTHSEDTTQYKKIYAKGIGLTLQNPSPKKGYAFGGWFNNPNYLGHAIKKISTIDSGDVKFYGKWWPLPKQNAGCYEIGSVDDLFGFAAIVNGNIGAKKDSTACGKLVADIEFKEIGELWTDSLLVWVPMWNFAGSFDGNGFSIKNIFINNPSNYYPEDTEGAGLFGTISGGTAEKPVVIKNLTLYEGYINGGWNTGSIAGLINESNVILDSITADLYVSGYIKVGGIVGVISSSTVSLTNSRKIFSNAKTIPAYYPGDEPSIEKSLYGTYNIGGLISTITNHSHVRIVNNYVKGKLLAWNCGIGAAVGIDDADTYISQFYAESDIEAESYAGGILGSAGGDVRIENSYHIGKVSSNISNFDGAGNVRGVVVGGIVGVNESYANIHLVNSYHMGDVTAVNDYRSIDGVIGVNHSDEVHIDNVFYPSSLYSEFPANAADSAMFANGSVAHNLHNYDNGSMTGAIWGQKVGVDPYPVFTSKVDGYQTDKKVSNLVLHTFEGDSIDYINHYTEGQVTSLPTVAREGHYFHGWFTEPQFLEDSLLFIDSKTTGDLELYAKLQIKKFVISVNIYTEEGCSGYVEGTGYFDYGTKTVLKVVPDSGCGLSSSYIHTPFDEFGVYTIDKVTKNESYNVHIGKGVYKIWYYVDEDVSLPNATNTRTLEDAVTLPIPSKQCYEFEGWYDNENLEGSPVKNISKGAYGDRKFWPKWKENASECLESSSSSIQTSSSSSTLIENLSSSSVAKSSSSTKASSSSNVAKSSSSKAESSSSGVAKSSSSTKASSSSNVAKSSSSKAKSSSSSVKKSSSSKTDAIDYIVSSNVKIDVIGRYIQIDGVQSDANYTLFDLQGKILLSGSVENGSWQIAVPRAGTYLLRVGMQMQRVTVK